MTERGDAKYFTVHKTLGERQLVDHLAGKATYGAPLTGRDGLAGAGVIELDEGVEAAALSALQALAAIGVTAFSFVTPGSGGHDGSHTWVLYRARGDPERIRALLRHAAESATLPSREIFPTNQAIRLPFGLHRRTRRRGVLLLQDGRRFDLDRGGLPEAMAAVVALPRNALPPPTLQRPPPRPAESYSPSASGQVIGDYCRATDLVELLASYPGYKLVSRTSGGAVLRCGCPHHKHGDRRPSLEVKAGRDGRQVVLGYAPGCIWHNERGRNDAFNVFCELERLNARDAVKRVARPAPSQQRRHPTHPAEAPALERPGPQTAEQGEGVASVAMSACGALAPESEGESESGYKPEACERGEAGQPADISVWSSSPKPGAEGAGDTSPGQQPLWGAPARSPGDQPRAKGKRAGLPRRAWAEADTPSLEQELRRLRGMLRHMRRGPARTSVERAAYQLGERIAARRDVGVAMMRYGNEAQPRQVDHPRCVAEGPAVAFEGGASFIPQGASFDALLEKLDLAPPSEELDAPSPPVSQAPGPTSATSQPIPSGALPSGWTVERCDHKGNLTPYGCYWLARGPAGDTEPTMCLDTACWQARRAAEAASTAGGSHE